MTLTISHQNYEAVRPDYGIFSVKFHSSISEYHRMYLHELMMRLAYTGSGGIVANYSDYSAYSFRIGSSTCVVAAQPKVRVARDSASLRPLGIQGNLKFTVFEQLQELQAALSLNKSQLAGILRVSRPT